MAHWRRILPGFCTVHCCSTFCVPHVFIHFPRQPCWRATVSSGNACNFCHLEHPDKLAKLDKKQRMLLQKLVRNTWPTRHDVYVCIAFFLGKPASAVIVVIYNITHCIIDLYRNHVYLIIRLWSICMHSPFSKTPVSLWQQHCKLPVPR